MPMLLAVNCRRGLASSAPAIEPARVTSSPSGNSERHNNESMKPSPWQTVEADRDKGFNNLIGWIGHGWHHHARPSRSHPLLGLLRPTFTASFIRGDRGTTGC